MLAVNQGAIAKVALLLPLTTKLDQQNQDGDTALMLAIRAKHLQIARALMCYPLNLFLVNSQQDNAFMLLAQQGYHQSQQHLLLARKMVRAAVKRFPFIVNPKVDGSHTLIALAANLDEMRALHILIARHADPTLPNQQGNTPLMLAIKQGHLFAANILSVLPNQLDQQNHEGDTALMLAIRRGYFQIATVLTSNFSQLNIFLTNHTGESALSLLFRNKMAYTTQEFLLATNLLTCAASSVSSEQIDGKVEGSHTLLCLAVMLNNMLIVKQLLEKNANLNLPNNIGDTPTMLAIKQKQLTLTQFLLSRRPDLSLKNHKGESAYNLALENGWKLSSLHIAKT